MEEASKQQRMQHWPVGLATPKNRLAAFVLDLILLVPLIRLLQAPLQKGMNNAALLESASHYAQFKLLNSLVLVLVYCLYHALFQVYGNGQTLGKRFFHIRVVPLAGYMSLAKAFQRAFVQLISLACLGLPLLSVFFHPLRRTVHDRFSDTLVVALKEGASLPTGGEKAWSLGVLTLVMSLLTLGTLGSLWFAEPTIIRENLAKVESCPQSLQEGDDKLIEAIEKHLAQDINDECLQALASRKLWLEEDEALANLAMSMALGEQQRDSDLYFESVCEVDPNSHYCHFAQWLQAGVTSKKFDLDFAESWFEDESVEDFIKLFAAHFATEAGDYDRAERWVGQVSRKTALSGKLAQIFLHVHLGQSQFDAAYALFRGHLSLSEKDLLTFLLQERQMPSFQVRRQLKVIDLFSPQARQQQSRKPASKENVFNLEVYRQKLLEEL